MSLVFSLQAYYTTSDAWREVTVQNVPLGHITLCEFVSIDCEEPAQPCIFLPLIERHLKSLLADGILTTGMRVSCCLFDEKCNSEMNDTSEVVTWFDTHMCNLHDNDSAWW